MNNFILKKIDLKIKNVYFIKMFKITSSILILVLSSPVLACTRKNTTLCVKYNVTTTTPIVTTNIRDITIPILPSTPPRYCYKTKTVTLPPKTVTETFTETSIETFTLTETSTETETFTSTETAPCTKVREITIPEPTPSVIETPCPEPTQEVPREITIIETPSPVETTPCPEPTQEVPREITIIETPTATETTATETTSTMTLETPNLVRRRLWF